VSRMNDHLMIAPVVVPFAAGAAMLLFGGERRRNLEASIGLISTLGLVAIATALLTATDAVPGGIAGVYRLGDWPAPYGIVLVLDRLSALMLLVTSLLASAALMFSLAGTERERISIHCSSSC
jgi:multicomponent K+:H+ antiporter subunit D